MRRKHKIVSVLLFSAAPLFGCAMDEAAPPEPEPQTEAQLIELRDELGVTPRADAIAQLPYFRPICDEQGYPLVGNVATKAAGYQPSQFCTEVRERQ